MLAENDDISADNQNSRILFTPQVARLAAVGDNVIMIWDATPLPLRPSAIRDVTD